MHEFYCMENRAEWRESPCAEAEIERDEQETCLNGFDCWLLPVRVRQQRQLNGYAIWLLCLLCQSNIHSYAYVSCTSSAHVRSGFFVVLLADVLIPAPGNNYNLYENECKIIFNRKQTRTNGKSILKTLFLVRWLSISRVEVHSTAQQPETEPNQVNINISNLSLCTYRYMSKLFKLFTAAVVLNAIINVPHRIALPHPGN